MKNLADIRQEYKKHTLLKSNVPNEPFTLFNQWLQEAIALKLPEPTAMTLATVNSKNRPSSRIVLLKDVSDLGFTFFTNYKSRKGADLENNPFASLLFFWEGLERQVRIEGSVEKTAAFISDNYFLSRPKNSRVGAWSSPQSEVIPDRAYLDKKFRDQSNDSSIEKRPSFWGGYILVPDYFEFWQGRESRLHDRIAFTKQTSGWKLERLAP